MFGSSVYPDSRPRVDVGSALDAIGNTATSLVQQAYNRKLGQQELALRQNQADLERQRFASESDFRNRDFTLRSTQADRDYGLRQAQSEREGAAAIAQLLPQGFAFDDSPTLTESAYSGGAPTQAGAPAAAAPSVRPARNMLNDAPGVHGLLDSAYGAPTAVPATAPPPPVAAAAPAAPSVTIGGRRLVYKGYGASTAGQAEKTREDFETRMKQQDQAFQKDFEQLRSGDEQKRGESLARLNNALELDRQFKLIPAQTKAKIQEEIAKLQYTMPKTEEMRIAGLMPELVSSVKNIDAYDAPELLTKLGARGHLGNYVVSPEGQQFNQSAAQMLQALAFARSGKRINDAEIERMRDAYIPKPGDTDGVLAKKRSARQLAIQGVLTGAGRGVNFVPQDDIDYLRSKGYASAAPGTTAPPSTAPADTGNVDLSAPAAAAPRRVGKPVAAAPAPAAPMRVGAPGSGPKAPSLVQTTQLRIMYDSAATHLKGLGKSEQEIAAELGPRP